MVFDLTTAEGVKEYRERIGTEFRYGCYEEKLPEICDRLGEFLDSIERDEPKARTVFEMNCMDNNYGESCHKAAAFYGRQDKWDQAYKFYKKGCENNSGKSCEGAGAVHEKLTGEVDGKVDNKGSFKYFEKGCENKFGYSCLRVSQRYFFGKEPCEKDMTKAFEYSLKACETQKSQCVQ